MKKLLILLLSLVSITTYGQQTLNVLPAGSVQWNGTSGTLDLSIYGKVTDIQVAKDSAKAATATANAANSNANSAYNAANNALTTANSAIQQNANQDVKITAANYNIGALQLKTDNLQSQIDNIAIPQNVGIPSPLVINSSYTLKLTDYDKIIFVNCSGCTVSAPALTPGFRVLIVREATSGTVYVKGSGATVAGASSIAVKGGSQWLTYKTSTSANLQVR
mgnify:CR=1 FL=1